MLGSMLAWGGFGLGGFGFADFLNVLENMGFFQFFLPFILIFAAVYAILTEIPTFKNKKGPALIIALAIGLLSLQLNFVPAFFQAIFPNFGIGLSILIVALILAGAFLQDGNDGQKAYRWIFFGLGALIFLIVTFSSLSDWHFGGSYWWNEFGGLIVVLIVLAGVITAVILGNKDDNKAPHA